MKIFNVGLIGYGKMGKIFAKEIKKKNNFNLKKIITKKILNKNLLSIKRFFNEKDIDVFIITSPISTHFKYLRYAYEANKDIIIENFQGERGPRKTVVVGNTKVIPKGEDVILTGEVWTDITQTAANIELKTKVKNKDHRVFLDGIYAFEKKKGIDK